MGEQDQGWENKEKEIDMYETEEYVIHPGLGYARALRLCKEKRNEKAKEDGDDGEGCWV